MSDEPASDTGPPDPPRQPPRGGVRRTIRIGLLTVLAAFVMIQLVPYGRAHTNPPVLQEPSWDSPATRSLVATSCFDCHSNQTQWYWYTNVAPFSWLVQNDVNGGRATLNFSEWNRPQEGTGDIAEMVRSGEMPPWYYTMIHWAARLSAAERRRLIDGLRATFLASPPIPGG